jgi:aryl-alcohol dehydrogenase-like predicted oxidoreductase
VAAFAILWQDEITPTTLIRRKSRLTNMQTVRLGRTGLEVSVAGLGCGGHSRLGIARGKDVHHAADMVRRALDLGVTYIDTARAYGTEEAVGLGLKGRRGEAVVSTKSAVGRGGELIGAADMAHRIDESLAKLQSDYIDVFLLHGLTLPQYDHATQVILPELRRQQAAGKIRFIAASEQFGADTGHALLTKALGDDPFDVVMVGFNLLNPSARQRVFPRTISQDVGTLIMFAVREALSHPSELKKVVGELIARGEVDPAKVDADDPLGFLKDAPGAPSVVEAAYRFCRHEPGAHVILTGTGDPAHLKANVEAILAPPLPPEVLTRLDAIFGAVDSVSGN